MESELSEALGVKRNVNITLAKSFFVVHHTIIQSDTGVRENIQMLIFQVPIM